MNIADKINNENEWKETAKKMIDMSHNYNEYQKNVLKFVLECYYNERKKSILKNATQVKILESIISDSNKYKD